MRMTPAQIAVELICGNELPMRGPRDSTMSDRIQSGHQMLIRITGEDFGHDLQKWHDYLKESRDGGYTWGRNIDLPRVMKDALVSTAWRTAVNHLEERSRRIMSRRTNLEK